ncbi:hypothetical protein [Lapidilactobacillus bayanensis]|uniref:hypothetical protein n=1 Tax=Lapidilactobacillus bayanensis TaxID=2485998 RepID=UPI000F7962B2|nr:hypothetical protein [Lapidilactobacillus bayanensis]
MSTNFLVMAILICLFDLVILILNSTRLKYRTAFSAWRALLGVVLAALIVVLLLGATHTDVNRNMVVLAIALTILTWGLLRKGLGERYAFISLSVNGLVDWRNIKTVTVEPVPNGQFAKLTATDFMKRSRVLMLRGDVNEIRAFAESKIAQNKL